MVLRKMLEILGLFLVLGLLLLISAGVGLLTFRFVLENTVMAGAAAVLTFISLAIGLVLRTLGNGAGVSGRAFG